MRDRESGDGAHRHHALGTQIQYTRFFRNQLPQRGNDQRRAGHDRRKQYRPDQIHQAVASFQRIR